MKGRGYLLATASGVAAAAAAGGAHAADMGLPAKAPYAPPPPVASWAGWYAGLNVGANWQTGNSTIGYANVGETGADAGSVGTRASGFIGGGQIGYNWQNGNIVFGLEGDISGLTGQGTATAFGGKTFTNQITWLSTIRARAGLVVGDNTLLYATGGLAVGGVRNTFLGAPTYPSYVLFSPKSESRARAGWTVGGGLEYMLNSHWTVAAEGLYVDLGTSSVTVTGPGGAKTATFSNRAAIARLKLNYKF